MDLKQLMEEFKETTGQLKGLLDQPVSYTHLDVYKRQGREYKAGAGSVDK